MCPTAALATAIPKKYRQRSTKQTARATNAHPGTSQTNLSGPGQLCQDCQQLLLLFFQKTPKESIAHTLNFASEGYARRCKHQCRARLIEQIKKDPKYQELLEV